MTDDATQDDATLDDVTEARVRHALAVTAPVPDLVWTSVERALLAEAAVRAAGQAATGTDGAPAPVAAGSVTPLRRRTPLLGGLLAAAAAVVAVAVIAPGLIDGSEDSAVVASDAQTPMPADAAAPMTMAEAAPADTAPADARAVATDDLTPAARQVMMSGTDYTPENIEAQVMRMVDTIDASQTRLLASVTQDPDVTEGSSGFTATAEGLDACMEALAQSDDRQALFVDRATFNGRDVGIVVMPVGEAASDPTTPFDAIDVWVVRPDCSGVQVQGSIVWHDTVPVPAP